LAEVIPSSDCDFVAQILLAAAFNAQTIQPLIKHMISYELHKH
jgi:hypothetical protein